MTRVSLPFRLAAIAGLAVLLGSEILAFQRPQGSQESTTAARWMTAWATSQQGLGTGAVTNATVRMIARVTISGESVRIRLDNTFGTAPLSIGKAYVGQRIQGAALAAGSNRPVSFSNSASVTVPAGGSVMSDPVPMAVRAQQDLAVSLHIPGAGVQPSQHTGAAVTSYLTANGSGDSAAEETAKPFTATTTSTFWLKAIDVSLLVLPLHRNDCRVRRFDYRRHVLDPRCPRPLGRLARRAAGARSGRPRQGRRQERRAQGHRQRGHRRQYHHA